MEQIDQHLCFGGQQLRFKHISSACQCDMHFSLFLPEQAQAGNKVSLLLWLSGLTCTDENFVTKAGAQQYANQHGIALLCPDTSPRGESIADDSAYDLGQGAGFYVNATQAPWTPHFNMYDYVLNELLPLVLASFPVDSSKVSISGHSMGGHGALVLGLRNPGIFHRISAFSPICAPSQCSWGTKALSRYLGANKESWLPYDACHLLSTTKVDMPILIDQGDEDNFLEEQLKPKLLEEAAKQSATKIELRMQKGYDHSYFFIASFIEDHIRFHAKL